jgi:hypothetical protein
MEISVVNRKRDNAQLPRNLLLRNSESGSGI